MLALVCACSSPVDDEAARQEKKGFMQEDSELLNAEVMAISYSGYREGQHPDRGDGTNPPSAEQVLEDLQILVDHGFGLIRVYDTGIHTQMTLDAIERHKLPIKVLLGMWLRAEFSNHEGCPWLDEPIPDETLAKNRIRNIAEIEQGIELARRYGDIVSALSVGNEALVDWNDHMVPLDRVIEYVRYVKDAVSQPVTVADNYLWWINEGAPLAAEVDFLGVHTYPAWESKSIDEGIAFTIENIEGVHAALPNKPIVILEAGWATTAVEFPETASEENQARHYAELQTWAEKSNVTVFFFEAFDEPWKGDPKNADGAEKHWGLFRVDRSPKPVMEVR
jgi:exo-beta-1,3-glucanase (GH17 family)